MTSGILPELMNALPRKILGYRSPEELFEMELDRIYAARQRSTISHYEILELSQIVIAIRKYKLIVCLMKYRI